jgi:hypothetical protein
MIVMNVNLLWTARLFGGSYIEIIVYWVACLP